MVHGSASVGTGGLGLADFGVAREDVVGALTGSCAAAQRARSKQAKCARSPEPEEAAA